MAVSASLTVVPQLPEFASDLYAAKDLPQFTQQINTAPQMQNEIRAQYQKDLTESLRDYGDEAISQNQGLKAN